MPGLPPEGMAGNADAPSLRPASDCLPFPGTLWLRAGDLQNQQLLFTDVHVEGWDSLAEVTVQVTVRARVRAMSGPGLPPHPTPRPRAAAPLGLHLRYRANAVSLSMRFPNPTPARWQGSAPPPRACSPGRCVTRPPWIRARPANRAWRGPDPGSAVGTSARPLGAAATCSTASEQPQTAHRGQQAPRALFTGAAV